MEIEDAFAVVAFDWKNLGENRLETEVLALGLGNFRLEKLLL